jgi:tRNA modification GTPase
VNDTIFALSSGSPPAAIAVVRISGPDADRAVDTLAGRLPEPRRASLTPLRYGGEVIDNALVVRFPAPASATGEDVCELHLHGGRSVVAAVLEALGSLDGMRPAQPGEFTRRAFENARIDLTEAEGLSDLLQAETQSQRRAAMALAGGTLRRNIELWQREILALAGEVEALLDFSDEGEVGEEDLPENFHERISKLLGQMEAMLARPRAERLREGVRVVIAGPPNAGKSTLLNSLAGRDAAITSEVAGTTRDVVEAAVSIAGMPFLLLDTAGLRDSSDEIERIGVQRARESLARADIILWLGDPEACAERERSILVHTKADLGPPAPGADLAVSARTGAGMAELIEGLTTRARELLPVEGDVALNDRHRAALRDCSSALEDCRKPDPLVAAEGLRAARAALDQVTGRGGVEDMLNGLFGNFCIGK